MPYARLNGIRIFYEDHGRGTPLVLIMGYGDDSTRWARQVPAFARRHRVIAFDNRGVGRSDAPRRGYSMASFARDTVALLDHLELERVHVLGYSMGGRIAQEVAIRHPHRLRSLILCSTSARPSAFNRYTLRVDRALIPRYGLGAVAPFGPLYQYTRAYFQRNFGRLVAALGRPARAAGPLHGLLGQARAIEAHDTSRTLHRITATTLVLLGDQELLNPLPDAAFLARRIPRARLRVLPGGGHGFLWEIPEAFNGAVLEFIRQVDARDAPGTRRSAQGGRRRTR
jgi:pimeloyl-ACP methyl ester carboxylesterase